MNILLLIRDRNVPSARYRVLQYIDYMESVGVRTHVEIIPAGWRARRRVLRSAADFDGVLLQKRLLRPRQAAYLRKYAKRLVYDFDDAVLYHCSTTRKPESGTRLRRFRAMMELADLVIAGNRYLYTLAEKFGANATIIPTVFDAGKYDSAVATHKTNSDTITLGWIGSASTVEHIVAISNALAKVGATNPKLRLKLICDTFPDLPGMRVEKKSWRLADEAGDVAGMDIGLAPGKDTPWTRGKCGLKILQYLAASLPVVCSPVGVHEEMVRDGINGYLADSIADWESAITRMAALSPEKRAQMGRAGRKLFEQNYTLRTWAPHFVAAVTGTGRATG